MRISPTSSPSIPKPSSRGSPPRSSPSTYQYQTSLALRTVVGTSTCNPNGFATYLPARQFAFCAGSTTVLAEIDDELNVSQRFFRARTSVAHGHPAPSSHVALAGAHNRPRAHSGSSRTTPLRNGSFGAGDGASAAMSARERVKSVTSVALSANGRWIAAGETGYSPRVLIFSTAPAPDSSSSNDAAASPLAVLNEHSFGVKSIAFSPDSQYLATLGDINDGFLHVWALNAKSGAAKLHSTNKCTSVVRGMCFVGNNVLTVGVRHIKAWRVEVSSPTRSKFSDGANLASPSPLTGRNCVLGSFGDSTFSCVASVSENEAVVCTESGAICLYDDKSGHQKLQFVQNVGFGILSVAYDAATESVWVAGKAQNMEKFSLEKLRETMSSASKPSSPAPSEGSSRPNSSSHASPAITCIALFPHAVITIDSTHSLRISSPSDAQDYNCDGAHQTSTTTTTGPTANRDAVMGISPLTTPNPFSADFFTWSAGGLVNFWDFSGTKRASQFVALGQPPHADDDANELKVVRTTPQGMEFFVAGDKYGVLSLFSGQRWTCMSSVRAHSAEITDIAIFQDKDTERGGGGCLIASCGRDRVVQLFRLGAGSSELELVQTLEEHVGAVNRVLFKNNGEKLLSCSSDRTIVIRERAVKETEKEVQVAYFSAKVITMKSSPVSMEPSPCDPDGLVVSSTDRYIHHYQVSSGRSLHSFRASDPETGDAVVMSSLSIACETPGQNPTLLVGVCSTDKSLRVYDFDRGTLLSGEFGHTEGVTDVILLEDKSDAKNVKKTLISTGMDGIVMMWDLGFSRQSASRSASPARIGGADGTQTPKKEVVVRQPLRRVISRSEMTGFQRADGQPPLPSTPSTASTSTANRDTSPARTVRPKNSRTSLKSNTYSLPSRTNTSNTLSTPTHTPGTHRLSAASAASPHHRFDRSPSPSRRRPNTSVGVGAGDSNAARRPSMGSNIRTNSSSSSTTRLTDSTPRRTTTRRMSLSTSNSAGTSTSTPSGTSSATPNSSATELSSINSSTEQMCRTLKAYRKKLSAAGTGTGLSELEAELKMTLKAVEEKAKAEKAEKGKHGERGHGHGHLHFSKRLSSITRKGKHSHGSDDSKR